MKIGEAIRLSDSEKKLCRAMAKARFENARSKGVKNSKKGNQSNEFTDLEGFASELAFCKAFNLYPDLTILDNPRDEDHGDARLPDGSVVDVKATKYKSGRLTAAVWKTDNVDLYALMVGEFPHYTFKGFMRREELCREERLGDLGHGKLYIAGQEELKNLEDVWKR